jgi:hypothetical protein
VLFWMHTAVAMRRAAPAIVKWLIDQSHSVDYPA